MSNSTIQSVELLKTHLAFGPRRHWVVSCNVSCPYHGSQIWTIEKFIAPGGDFIGHNHQMQQDGTIYFSCSSYMNRRGKKIHYFSSPVTMAMAASSITSSRIFIAVFQDCVRFARKTFKDIKNLDNSKMSYGRGYNYGY